MLKKQFTEEITLNPIELAEEFCEMDGDQQAEFFNAIGYIVNKSWNGRPFDYQMYEIIHSAKLNKFGEHILEVIKQYVD